MKRYPRLTVYRAADGWRWRMVAGGRVVAESGGDDGFIHAKRTYLVHIEGKP